jgi:universal stress protein A
VVVADPVQAILAAAPGCTAIVIGTLGLTGLTHLVIGSVAEKVVRHATIPVLTLRSGVQARVRRASRRGRWRAA